jgi:hypothetical protein
VPVAVALGLLAVPAPAFAAAPKVETVSKAYDNPLQLAVRGSRVLVTDGNRLTQVGRAEPLATGPSKGEISGIALDAAGTAYAYGSSNAGRTDTRLTIVKADGSRVVASLSAFEKKKNPDGGVAYGVRRPSSCVRAAFKALDGGPAGYPGRVDSRPYAVASAGTAWYVADAGANAVLKVDTAGRVSRVAVLPRQPFRFSSKIVEGLGMPRCVVGVTYQAEPVPTDVEVGPDGALYVTTLPGLYDLGQKGAVYRVDPRTGRVTRVAAGFAGAVNVAVSSAGRIFVAELLSGRVSRVKAKGKVVGYVKLRGVAGLEWSGGRLHASVMAPVSMGVRTGPGRIVRIG